MRCSLVLLVLALIGGPASANQCPDDASSISIQPVSFDWGNTEIYLQFVMGELRYRHDLLLEPVLSNQPVLTVGAVAAACAADYGLMNWSTHGSVVSLATEFFQTQAQRDARLSWYLQNGWTATELRAANVDGMYAIGMTVDFFRRWSYYGSIIHLNSCKGSFLEHGFIGALAVLAYDDTINVQFGINESNRLYRRLYGVEGVQFRTIGQALSGLRLRLMAGADEVELAPMVQSTNLVPEQNVSQFIHCYVKFSSPVLTLTPASSFISASGAFEVQNVTWQGDDQIAFRLVPRYLGPGQVRVACDTTGGPAVVSIPGLIPLVGNTQGQYPGVNGQGPSGPYVFRGYSTTGGDNPAARVTSFVPLSAAEGNQVRWTVEGEHHTATYRVDRADGWNEQFVPVQTVPATGAYAYAVTDALGQPNSIYRLVETETDGDTLVHGIEQAMVPFTLEPDPEISTELGESLTAALLEQYPTPEDINPTTEWVAVIKDESYRSAIQPLINYHQSRGLAAQAVTLAQVNAYGGLRQYVAMWVPYDLRFVVLCGDESDYLVHRSPENAQAGFPADNFPLQPQHSVMPMDYLRDPGGTYASSFSFFHLYFSTDALKVDLNGDSLPDVAYGRLPCRTPAELAAIGAKVIAGDSQSQAPGRFLITGEFNHLIGNDGDYARSQTDHLATLVPAGNTLRKLYNVPPGLSYASRETQLIGELNQAPVVWMALGTLANRSKIPYAPDKTLGFAWNKVSPVSRYPFFIGASCDMLDIDRTEDPAFGRPLIELALMETNRGPYGAVGFTRGTWQYVDYLVAEEFLKFLYVHGTSSVGEAWMATLNNVAKKFDDDPRITAHLMSGIFIGDPATRIPGMVVRTTAVGDPVSDTPRERLAPPFPNPGYPLTNFRFGLESTENVQLRIYDLQGRTVRTLIDGSRPSGTHTESWNGQDDGGRPVANGLYFARLRIGQHVSEQKVTIAR